MGKTSFLELNGMNMSFSSTKVLKLWTNYYEMTSLLWNDIKLSWKLHLLEHLFQIFTYKYGIVVTF